MDVSSILAPQAAQSEALVVEKETPLDVDAGLLMVTDLNPIDEENYNENIKEHLQSLARDGVQVLLAKLFSLPTLSSPDGPLAQLPSPAYKLPRAKPLPKPKPPTKWERFASAKGIQHKTRDKKIWDEERQKWVNRWGRDGKNRQAEEQWITEVPRNADINFNPQLNARKERKERVAKNEKRHQQNFAHALGASISSQKKEIEKTLATTRISTASMGKFDNKLSGEKNLRGIKRKFEPTEMPIENEKIVSLNLITKMESESKKMRKTPKNPEKDINVRKAIRFATAGKGGSALRREASNDKNKGKHSTGKKGRR